MLRCEGRWDDGRTAVEAVAYYGYSRNDRQYFLLSMDMPGVNKADLNVTLENDTLNICGVRQSDAGVIRYERNFELNRAVRPDGIEARLTDGVLNLVLPKPESVKPLQISIEQN